MNLVDEKALFPKLPAVARVTLASICLVLLTIAVFWQVAQHEFISYDDPEYVTNNPHVRDGFTSEGIRWAFTQLHGETTYWHPVTWLSHMLDCELFDLNAGAHHLVNVALHSANAVLLFLWLATLSGAFWRSWLVAAIFALHPIQVDTVAWIAERKNVLSTLFLFVILLCYSRYVRRRTARWYAISLLCFAVGLMCKPMLVTVPGILLLLDFWPLQRFPFTRHSNAAERSPPIRDSSTKWLLLEKIPFLTLAIISAVITVRAHQELGMERLPLSLRLGNAAVSYIRYIGKTLAPHKLAIFYPHPGKWPAWMVAGSAILLAAFSIAALRTWRRYPALTFGWLWFLLTLIPVLGIVQAGMQAMADRFAYVPMIGFLVLIVWAASELLRDHSRVAAALGAAALAGCIAVTGIQLRYWQNNETLWRHALDVTSNNFIAHYGLGYVLIGQEKYDEALFHTEKALRLKPDLVLSHYQIAVIKDRQGKYDEAIPEYEQALKMKWDWAEAHRALLNAYYHAGKTNLAINHLKKLVDAAPQNPGGHFELAEALNAAGNFPEAVQHYRDVARLAPLWAIPRNNLAWILATNPDATLRNGQEAVALAERACELTAWNQPVMIGTLAAAYAENGQFDKATEMAQRAANLADSIGEKAIAAKNRELLVLYTEKKPYRDTPK